MKTGRPDNARSRAGRIAGVLTATLLAIALTLPASGRETIKVTKEDYKVDTAIAVYFEGPDGKPKSYIFALGGQLTQMLMCKGTLKSRLPHIMKILRTRPEYKNQKVLGAECVRTSGKPIPLNP